MEELYEFLAKGGPIMVPILLFSVIALAAFIHKIWQLRQSLILPEKFIHRVEPLLEEGRLDEAAVLAESSESAAGRIMLAAIPYAQRPRHLIREVIEDAGRLEVTRLEKGTGIVSTIATVSPLMGLLGTVTGMIAVFQQIVVNGSSQEIDTAALAGGIWEAMLTTATGLAVAIPAYIGYRYLLATVDARADGLAQLGIGLLERLSPESDKPKRRSQAKVVDGEDQ